MRFDILPGTGNVVRFPLERRGVAAPAAAEAPTLDLVRALAPDPRAVFAAADAFGLDPPPPDLRHRADAETAAWIAEQVPAESRPERDALLADLLPPLVAAAVAACRASRDAWDRAGSAEAALRLARAAGRADAAGMAERLDALANAAAALRLDAYARCEEAEGVARAVALARCGRPWTPHDPRAEERALFGPVPGAG